MDTASMWKLVTEDLEVSLSSGVFSWFKPLTIAEVDDSQDPVVVTIASPSAFHQDFVQSKLKDNLIESLSRVIGKPAIPNIIVSELAQVQTSANTNSSPTNETESLGPLFNAAPTTDISTISSKLLTIGIRETSTFDNYAVSSSNEVAFAAAKAVADNLGKAYNPLFFYGDVGVGKTHLMQAIAIELVKKQPDIKLQYCAGESFTNEIIEAIQRKNTMNFRQRYRSVQALFIDDIQFIAGKNTVQEEFFHTFNALHQAGHQVVMTSDRPPSEIKALEDRLRSRFEAGLIVDIGSPNFELKTAIILIKAKEKNLLIPMETAKIISSNLDSARQIEGFLVKVQLGLKTPGAVVSPTYVQGLLQKTNPELGQRKVLPPLRPNEIIKGVCKYFELSLKDIKGKRRQKGIVRARHLAMYIMRIDYEMALDFVGTHFSNRDHTTVMHAVDKITATLKDESQLRVDLAQIRQSLYGGV